MASHQETIIVRARPELADAWERAGRPSLTVMVDRAIELGHPLRRSTIHALLAYARGNSHRAYSGRLGITKARALAEVLDVRLSDVFEHTNDDPIRESVPA